MTEIQKATHLRSITEHPSAYGALQELLRRARSTRANGTGYIRLDFGCGSVRRARLELEEIFDPATAERQSS